MPDTVILDHFEAARTALVDSIAQLDGAEIELRNNLDEVLGERSRQTTTLRDLTNIMHAYAGTEVLASSAAPKPELPQVAADAPVSAPATEPAGQRPTPPRAPRAGSVVYEEVAAWIISARAVGEYSLVNLAKAFDRPESAVKNWPGKCRQLGLLEAAPAGPTAPPAPAASNRAKLLGALAAAPALPPVALPIATAAPARPATATGVSLDEVAAVVAAGHAAGQLPLAALVAHFGKPESTVKNWLHRARTAGLIAPSPRAAIKVIEDNTLPTVPVNMPPLQEIADTFREAVAVSRKPIQTIVDRYDCTREVANEWVALARAAGLLPPKGEPVTVTDAPHQFVARG